jgi:probable HAF family extracellular repeat protein
MTTHRFSFTKDRLHIHISKTPRQASRLLVILISFALMCAMACFASPVIAQTRYQIVRIPTSANSVALGLNDKGEVVGYSFQGDDYQAFLFSYADRSMSEIGSLGGKLNAACAINAAGQVTGYSQEGNGNLLAFIFSRNTPIESLGALEGGSTSEAFGINNRGEVVGDGQGGDKSHRPVLFSNNSVQDLGLANSNDPDALETAYAINDSGQIVGRRGVGNNAFHAFLYSNGNITDFSTLGGANGEALAINKHGHFVGDSDTADGATHAFVFDGSLKDLGTLPGYENASYARGINNFGEIVGESDSADQKRAFVYRNGRLVQLNALAQNLNEAGFTSLDVAYGINDKGWIVGYGTTSDNLTAAFVAVPEGSRRTVEEQVPAPPPQVQKQKQLPPQEEGQAGSVSEPDEDDYDVFYSRLSPEGTWIEAGSYGYCFRPRVARDWRPYEDGHWIWTDRGWCWDSNEPFGWATYHYGRWVRIGGTGWCWVPGHQWAPAWVSWRESDDYVGWAPLPPEADVSVNVSISSWSDSYFGIGPAAYTFIRFSHWSAPSYVRYVEPPAQNVTIINRTTNVTNIVNNNTVINNYGPQVQTVAARTKQNIQQVKLAVNPATGPNAKYGQSLKGNQLNVLAPPPVLKPVAKQIPPVKARLARPVVQKGWQGVKPADAAKLKKTITQQNPPPKDLPKPSPVRTPQILKKGQAVASPSPVGTPVPGQKQMPPNLAKPTASPGAQVPTAKSTPGGSPTAPAAAKKPVPPNLVGQKPAGTPGGSPAAKPPGTPGPAPTAGGSPKVAKPTPPNLVAPKTSPAPVTRPAATPISKPRTVPPGQTPRPTASPPTAAPVPEKKPAAAPTPQPKPTAVVTPKPPGGSPPKPTPQVKAPRQQRSTPKPPPVAAPKPTPKATAPTPKPHPQAKASTAEPQPKVKSPASKAQPQAKPSAPKPQPRPRAAAPKLQPQKPAAQKAPAKPKPSPTPKK